jgi:electron transport complex protein RnfG
MYRAMVGVALLSGALIVTVFEVTRPAVERQQAAALRDAIFDVLPAARSSVTFRLDGNDRFTALDGDDTAEPLVHVGYDTTGRLVGVAVEARGMGYQDTVRFLYGYSFTDEAVVGFRVLESRETPGLGDRVETDIRFLDNFNRLDVALTRDGSDVANPIALVRRGVQAQPWQIDGITGATITSGAVARILRDSTAYWVPRLRRGLDDLRGTG